MPLIFGIIGFLYGGMHGAVLGLLIGFGCEVLVSMGENDRNGGEGS